VRSYLHVRTALLAGSVRAGGDIESDGSTPLTGSSQCSIGLTGLVDQGIHAKELPRGRVVVAPNRELTQVTPSRVWAPSTTLRCAIA